MVCWKVSATRSISITRMVGLKDRKGHDSKEGTDHREVGSQGISTRDVRGRVNMEANVIATIKTFS